MPQMVDTTTGASVGISDAEAPYVVNNGRIAATPQVVLVSPSGSRFDSPGDNPKLNELLGQGWRIESPEETRHLDIVRQYGDSGIRTAIEGAASATTLGLSDLLQTKLGLVEPEALAGRREANPGAYALGQVGGIAASLLVPGAAASAATRFGTLGKALGTAAEVATAPVRFAEAASVAAGEKVAATLAQTLLPAEAGSSAMARALSEGAKLATQGVVDGALFGTGQLVSEHALGDTELNTERLISHIGMPALIGGAVGGALGGVIGIASPAAEKARKYLFDNLDKVPGLSKEATREFLENSANRATLASVGATTKTFRELDKRGLVEISAKELRELVHPDGKKVLRAGAQFDEIVKRLTETAEAIGADVGAPIDALDAAGIGAGIGPKDLANDLRKKVRKPLEKRIGQQSGKTAIDTIIDELEAMPEGEVSNRWLQDRKGDLRDAYKGNLDLPSKKAQQEAERIINDRLEQSLEKNLSAEDFAKWKDDKRKFWSIKTLESEAALNASRLEANRYFSLSDRITGATATAGAISGALAGDEPYEKVLGGVAGSAVAHILARQFRTRAPSVLAVLLGKAARMMATEEAVKIAANTEASFAAQAAEAIFKSKTSAPAKSQSEIFNIQNETNPRTTSIAINEPLWGANVQYSPYGLEGATVGQKTFQPTALVAKERQALPEPQIIYKVNGYPIVNKANREFVAMQSSVLRQLASNPNTALEIAKNVDMHLGDIAPQMSGALTNKMMSMISFLAAKAPQDEAHNHGLTPMANEQWIPSNAQTMSYLRYAEAIKNPYTVIKDASNGIVNHEGAEVLKTLYPSLHNSLVLDFLTKVGNASKPIPYNKRVALTVLLGIPNADITMLPQYIASMQAGYQQQAQQQQVATQTNRPITGKASQQLDKTQKQNMTSTERIEAGPGA